MNLPPRPLTLLVCALGGEGGGVLAEWIVETATACGHAVQSTSIPGVAQRTGATTYYVEVYPVPDRELAGARPLFSLNPAPGGIDLLVSSELLETVRQVGLGMATAERTRIVTADHRALTVAEKMQPADGRVDAERLRSIVQAHAREAIVLDLAGIAKASGTAISAVLFGAIAGTGLLPLAREACEETIRRSGLGVDASLRGFAAAYERVTALRATRAAVELAVAGVVPHVASRHAGAPKRQGGDASTPAEGGDASTPAQGGDASTPAQGGRDHAVRLPDAERWPASLRELVALGHARVAEYQDAAYGRLYLERLARVLDAERAGRAREAARADRIDPTAATVTATAATQPTDTSDTLHTTDRSDTTREVARWLALWMAFDDIVRVAQLKVARSRLARVQRELRAEPGDVVRVWDHFKPGIPELAGLLPRRGADALARWERRRIARGAEPFALPLKIGVHTLGGALALRVLAAARGWRRRGSRWASEQALIERWLQAVERGAREHPALGFEIAACGRLVKGYGATNERGKATLLHVVEHLAEGATDPTRRAEAIRAAREAALADASGRALDDALGRHGAPPRPAAEQPIRIVRRRAHVGKATSTAHARSP